MSLDLTVGKFIEKERLFHDKSTLLCAVSGGIDSMVMLELLRNRGYEIVVAHVNYMLRGEESNLDQKLVESYCDKHQIKCLVRRLDQKEVNSLLEGNLQEKAREIRYQWFVEITNDHKIDYICTGHHQEDVAETFFLQALRRAGITGLSSIKATNEIVRRPLLSAAKEDIEQYASGFNIAYRVDKSNEEDKYDRNYIRNQIIPALKDRWPNATESIGRSIEYLSLDNSLLKTLVAKEKEKWLKDVGSMLSFGPIDEIRKLESGRALAFHLLRELGFDYSSTEKIIADNHTSGALFSSNEYEGVIDRNHLLIRKKRKSNFLEVKIDAPGYFQFEQGNLRLTMTAEPYKSQDLNIEILQASKIKWPLIIRTWQQGDIFKPLGMNSQSKKVSDLLIDLKVNRFEKENQLLLIDNTGEIIWVIGRRLSESVKLSEHDVDGLKAEWS